MSKTLIRLLGIIIFAAGAVWMFYQLGTSASIAILMVVAGFAIQLVNFDKLKKQS